MRQGWFNRVDEMLRKVQESTNEQWNCSAIEELFDEKVSTSYTIISAIGSIRQSGHGNRRSVSTQALKEFLGEFLSILGRDPDPEAIEAARLHFKQKVKSRPYQEPEPTDKVEADPTSPHLSTITTSECLVPISKEQASAGNITPAKIENQPLSDPLPAKERTTANSEVPEDWEEESLRHANWECRYYIALIPRVRYMAHFENNRRRLTGRFQELAEQKHCRAETGKIEPDHVEMIISVPPYTGVGSVIKHLRDRSSLIMTECLEDFDQIDPGLCYWERTYFAPLAKFDIAAIRELMTKRVRKH